MKFDSVFKDKLGCTDSTEVFDHLIKTLKKSITKWDYFVNWQKANAGVGDLEINLNLLNYLVGKPDIKAAALKLLTEHPQVIHTIPALLACRQDKFYILKAYQNGSFTYANYDFSKKSKISPQDAVEFMEKSGFLEQLQSERIKSLVDYVLGVEVGLDSNGRKNRGGTSMEDIVEFFVSTLCKDKGYEYMTQATAPKIKQQWGHHVTVDKSTRRIDFAINTPQGLVLIETNFYGGGGSKLKSTAGEYKTLYDCLSKDGHKFIWVTDGMGWKTTQRPLEETFNHIDHMLNLSMIEKGLLSEIVA
jgi:type II restriction enzyme